MLPWLSAHSPANSFPPTATALAEPNGLLAAGGDLSVARLHYAYQHGIFPWYSEGEPLLWWTPSPRSVLLPSELRVSRSLRKRIRRGDYRVTFDTCFGKVVLACAVPRRDDSGTWIDADMHAAYLRLHLHGVAHSVECWQDDELVGGLYGIALGSVFFGESMFSRQADASKVALATLCQMPFTLVDCQIPNPHLVSLGARDWPREQFESHLRSATRAACVNWQLPSL